MRSINTYCSFLYYPFSGVWTRRTATLVPTARINGLRHFTMAAELRLGAAELRELNRIGVNLNQMARALNSGAVSSPAETQAAVERVGELVAKLLAGERE